MVLEVLNDLLRDVARRPSDHFGLFLLDRNIKALDLLPVLTEFRLYLRVAHLADRLHLGLLDADQGGVAELVDAALNGQYGGQRKVDVLIMPGFELAFEGHSGIGFLNADDDRSMRQAKDFGEQDSGLRGAKVIGLQSGNDEVEFFLLDGGGDGARSVGRVEMNEFIVF